MILLFSDIHGNKKAAQLIESIAGDFDEIICCGDICGYNLDFSYCISMFKEIGIRSVRGNHDYMVLNRQFELEYIIDQVAIPIARTRELINAKEIEYLESLPLSLETTDGLFIIHTFGIDQYIMTPEACYPLLGITNLKKIAIGHTHVMQQHSIEDVTIINPGSISKGRLGTSPSYMVIDNGKVIERRIESWR